MKRYHNNLDLDSVDRRYPYPPMFEPGGVDRILRYRPETVSPDFAADILDRAAARDEPRIEAATIAQVLAKCTWMDWEST